MKKASLLIFLLVLFSGLAFGAIVTNTNTNSLVRQQAGMIEIDMKGQEIATSNSINFDFDWIGEWDAIDFYIESISTGNISTANLSWRNYPATTGTEMTSVTLTSGTPVVVMKTGYLRLSLTNSIAIPAFVTGSVLLTND